MKIRVIIGLVAIVGVSVCGFIAGIKHLEIVDKVNEKLLHAERFDPVGWYWSRNRRLRREYKRLYPDGSLPSHLYIAAALAFACLLISAWGFSLFAR
ncbi:MAG: hypothetical protein WA197_25935 [Candidatus Acidiferrales bacterium]